MILLQINSIVGKMHICYVIWKFSSPNNFLRMGGAEKQLLKIIDNLRNNKSIKITVIARKMPENPKEETIAENIKIKRLLTTNIPLLSMILFSISLFFGLVKLNKKEKIDLIHLPLPDLYLISVRLTRAILKIPFISRIAADELDPKSSRGMWLIERLYVRSLILKSDAIQTLTEYATKKASQLLFDPDKIHLIPNGVEIPKKIKDYTLLSYEIVYIGAMRFQPKKLRIEQKNLEFLIRSFKIVSDKLPKLKLIMVGDGNYRAYLEKIVEKLNIQKKVIFTGYQTDINSFLERGDIFVNPSHFEGMPNAVLEAMAKGVLVFCSNIPEHQYIIQNNNNGVLFNHTLEEDLAERILDFYKKPGHYFDIADKGRSYVIKNHSIQELVKLLLEMYNTIINS